MQKRYRSKLGIYCSCINTVLKLSVYAIDLLQKAAAQIVSCFMEGMECAVWPASSARPPPREPTTDSFSEAFFFFSLLASFTVITFIN